MVLEASLVDFYAKCADLVLSVSIFDEVRAKNKHVWGVLMRGFIQNGQFADAITLFWKMQDFGYDPCADSLRGIIFACTELGYLRFGKGVHGYLIRKYFCSSFNMDTLETSILNMYAKCGSIVLARRCFDKMLHKDIIAWSSMVEGYAIHGLGSKALELFHQMQEEGVEPNSITFLSLLSACSHSGLITEGCDLFDSMSTNFGIQPELNHYTCIVDLLGRCGKLYEALEVINNMKCKPDARIWGALLSSCWVHSDDMLGSYAAQQLFKLEPGNMGYHVVLSNINVGEGKWEKAETIRKDVNIRNVKKKPGWSCIGVQGRFYVFVAADTLHPQVDEIYRTLVCLTWHTEGIGDGGPHVLSTGIIVNAIDREMV
ncbi:pentatricopeptide repeat-containing protein At4g30700-like [Asparagus officinalis]|nr:pentatricopeptide repeat-containing protein At4g30700-like [Asparagus officinalis]XP_020275553.1 pentatricopeptide repeat-containing protein At4g30700-like [Asparagus officinalis]XP_020275560.1 pentatricopeptide repeat-containing protein At4g30700-like [Asparagus officinalis]XP_020275568.1 pentatricopeptide repeat-containing protein At4g30700-like [Asparagus officinalis]XP_020275574.1 pentatricopeptide repeat-containing protein At4g30700-like [Asparagus officinalis]XP_020275580.1 pentatrico